METKKFLEQVRNEASDPIIWECMKKHKHTTRNCNYSMAQPTWDTIKRLLDIIDELIENCCTGYD